MPLTTSQRLEQKAKIGWACFFKSENQQHKIHQQYLAKINNFQEKLKAIEESNQIPNHIILEITGLYDDMKKVVDCPICLEVIPNDKIKFTSCGHKYCEPCLKQLKSQPSPKCAMCRKKIWK